MHPDAASGGGHRETKITAWGNFMTQLFRAAVLAFFAFATTFVYAAQPPDAKDVIPSPTEKDWLAIAKLPDWSGIWVPMTKDQDAQMRTNPTPWTPNVAKLIAWQVEEAIANRPAPLFVDCLPEGMPSWMLITHNSMEILFTPGRVTMLGESDGNRLRRIYTDGRPHPKDPDETFHGHSIGHWEGGTLVIDTVGVLPEAWIAIAEHLGVPNNGDLHITERIRLDGPNFLRDELTITAPKVLTQPWKTTRSYIRSRQRSSEIVEGQCIGGNFAPKIDERGNHVFVPIPHTPYGNYEAPPRQR
jgi:hypothetical protein